MVYGAMGGKVSRAQRCKTRWNGYQSLATSKKFKAEELGRSKGALKWDGKPTGDQLKATYRLFTEEQEEERPRESSTYGVRCVRLRMCRPGANEKVEYFYNRFNIQFWGLLAGGQVRTDQLLTHIFEPNGSGGFTSKGLAVDPEDLKDLYILNQNAAKFTNQQIAAMGRRRGLKVSGPGLDDDDEAHTTTPSPTSNPSTPINSPKVRRTGSVPVPASKKNVRDVVRDIQVKTCFDKCLTPLGKTSKVPANLPCGPDNTGKVERIFVKDVKPDGAEPTKAGSTTSKKVKFEAYESIPPAEASFRTGPKHRSRDTAKPIYGLKDDFALDSSAEEDELETLKPAKKGMLPSKF
ncbi:hypothetical protein PM082_010148 [Marasmius tenuissimus]|nr:hypothetical protein PM082_010148 [Marasmius tenuissimus]